MLNFILELFGRETGKKVQKDTKLNNGNEIELNNLLKKK
jgi:hypothetical protein